MQPSAMQMIVGGYVRLGDRRALDGLITIRKGWIANLRRSGGQFGPFNASSVIALCEGEIAIVEAGLAQLNKAAAA